jgi:hypothetical protein
MATYTPLQSIVLNSATTSVTLSNISQEYTDLFLTYNGTESAQQQVVVTFNGSSASYYSHTRFSGNGATASTDKDTNRANIFVSAGNVAELSTALIFINNYSNTTTFKTLLSRWGNPSNGNVVAIVGLWRGSTGSSTEAINSITISTASAATFGIGSTFDLYGIKAGTPKAIGGDVVTTDGTYWYHAFKNSGILDIQSQSAISADILVVAGGGGAGGNNGGGGGAGGLVGLTSQSLLAGASYVATVGAGGAPSPGNEPRGYNGGNSQFGLFTAAVGGGGGGSYFALTPGNGGSGGGGGGNAEGGSASGGSPTSGQGYAGGNGQANSNPNHSSGGGGGAGGAGANGSGTSNGGIGATHNTSVGGTAGPYSFINAMGAATSTGQLSGGNYYYAGGGGGAKSNTAGGSGGLGGGGNGGGATMQNPGTPNTGGGGGGQPNQGTGSSSTAKAGGSGVIIVRYPV